VLKAMDDAVHKLEAKLKAAVEVLSQAMDI